MRIKCRAYFPENSAAQFGFYGMPGEAHRRIKNGQEFYFEFDERKHKITEINGRHFVGSWVEVLEPPKKKQGPKKKTEEVKPDEGNNDSENGELVA